MSHASETNGWATTIPADTSPGKTLYYVEKAIVDSTGVATSTNATWSGLTVKNISSNAGAVYRCYSKFTGTGATPSGTATTAVGVYPAANAFTGATFNAAFAATAPSLSVGETLWVADGYTNSNGTITWNTPYLSTFRVGSLSAMSADLGAITSGTITMDTTGHIKGGQTDYMTGTGFFLGYRPAGTYGGVFYPTPNYRFSIGSPTRYMNWDGTNLTFAGDINTSGVVTAKGVNTAGGVTCAIFGSGLTADSATARVGILGVSDKSHGGFFQTNAGAAFAAVWGVGNGAASVGVLGQNSGSNPAGTGVRGESDTGAAILGIATGINGRAVHGYAWDSTGIGVYAQGRVESTMTIRATGVNAPSTGSGVEVLYTGGTGYVQSYNRGTSAYTPLIVSGSRVTINGSGTGNAAGTLGLGIDPNASGGLGVLVMANRDTAPSVNIAGGTLYVEAGALKFRGSSGTITTIANA